MFQDPFIVCVCFNITRALKLELRVEMTHLPAMISVPRFFPLKFVWFLSNFKAKTHSYEISDQTSVAKISIVFEFFFYR